MGRRRYVGLLLGESLESRRLLNAAPVAVPDQYEIETGSVLIADGPRGVDSFAVDFGDNSLGTHLQGDGFVVQDGKVRRAGASGGNDRAYVRTVKGNYRDVDFRFEVSFSTSNTLDTAIYFVGLGQGVGDESSGSGEPQDSLFLRMHGPTTAGGYVGVSNSPATDFDVVGNLPLPGVHRVRVDKVGNAVTFSIDQGFNGTFQPDVSYAVDDIAARAPFLTNTTTHLFFGSAIEQDFFDDVAVEVSSVPGILANDTDDDGDELSAELTSPPSHGTVALQENGTFTYQPSSGFVGVDSFAYSARDGETTSAPARVTILVSPDGTPPEGAADHYEITQDSILAATRPQGIDHFGVDFENDTLFPHLEGTGFLVQDGVARRLGAASSNDRAYIRTKEADFIDLDFRYEASLTTSQVDALYFVGMGSGRGQGSFENGEPRASLHLRIHGPNTANGRIDVAADPAVRPLKSIGFLGNPGTHRVRLEKIGNALTFSIDAEYDGQFAADLSYTVNDVAALAPFLTDANTHLFFGTAQEEGYFDDVAVTFLTPLGVLANDIDAGGDALTAELLTAPMHGRLDLEADGTFQYVPDSGYVGTDSFIYQAFDADVGSEPTTVSIMVTSTNVAPKATPDYFQIVAGQSLQTTLLPQSQRISRAVFATNFDDGVPDEFAGATTLSEVQGYAGLGTGENVFAGHMLRNQTGMATPMDEEPFRAVTPTRLLLRDLPDHESLDVDFLFAAIDSWDGNTPLPDIMAVTVDGEVVFVETLDGEDLADQSYEPPTNALLAHGDELGFHPIFGDAAYDMSREPRFHNIPHTSSSVAIEWFTYGSGWTAAFDENESWAIDNVEVTVNSLVHSPVGVLFNDTDANGQSLAAILERGTQHGSLTLAADGTFSYTPAAGFTGVDSFAYRADDGHTTSQPTWVTIEVRPNGAGFSLVDDRYDIAPDEPFFAGERSILRDIGTGIDQDNGQKLLDLSRDSDYRVVASPGGAYDGRIPRVMPGEQPIGGYLPDGGSRGSRWIGILHNLPNEFGVEAGEFVFETTIEIKPDTSANSVFIQGLRLAADDAAVAVTINGLPVLRDGAAGFDQLTAATDVGLGAFTPGVNVIQFKVVNHNGGGRNPMGLRVEGSIVGQPSSGVVATTGLLANDFLSELSPIGSAAVSVGATADPWLAGMPDGASASLGDVAPSESPAPVTSFPLHEGDILRFDATGMANNSYDLQAFPITGPDGGDFLEHESGAENGLSNLYAPVNALVGVFLSDSQPNFFAPPAALDFRSQGNVPGGIDYARLLPQLSQVFFIGDGFAANGVQQEVVAPKGATRLFLGTMDGARWSDNIGRFDVRVRTNADAATGVELKAAASYGQLELSADGGFAYTPQPGFTGFDRFTYEVRGGLGNSGIATVVLRVGDVRLPGDVDGNGEVAFADFLILAEHFGQLAASPTQGDVDRDGEVGFSDFLILANNFGRNEADPILGPIPFPGE